MKAVPSRTTKRPVGPSPAKQITDAIIARLEAGVSPWRRTWAVSRSAGCRPMRACGQPYGGINALWLWVVADQNGYTSPTWMTYRQSQELGGQVRKGERGTIAVFYKTFEARDTDVGDESEASDDRMRRVLRSYMVFNCAQIDGLSDRFTPPPEKAEMPAVQDDAHRAEIDAFIAGTGAIIQGGDEACYIPSRDVIHMPLPAVFENYAAYGATAGHELIHWSGAKNRLDRDLTGRFGSDSYCVEELIAELGSCLLGSGLGLPVTHLDNHASYIASWLRILKADECALLTAAARAEEAASWLLAQAAGVAANITVEPMAMAA